MFRFEGKLIFGLALTLTLCAKFAFAQLLITGAGKGTSGSNCVSFTANFSGTNGTKISSLSGWSNVGSTGVDVAQDDGSGGLGTSDTTSNAMVVYHETGGTNHYADITLGTNFQTTASNGLEAIPLVVIRGDITRGNGGYLLQWNITNGGWRALRIDTLSTMINVVDAGAVSGQTVRFKASGSTVSIERPPGTVLTTFTDSFFTSQTKVSVYPRSSVTATALITGLTATCF